MVLASFRRITTSNRLIPEVDGFRFFAILIVVVAHTYAQCDVPVSGGALSALLRQAFGDGTRGVRLFFVLSGFILALPFARSHLFDAPPVNLRSYFRRRFTRLEPPYALAMLLRFPLVALYRHAALGPLALHLAASLFYLHGVVYGQASSINPPAWSLEVEIQFYLLAPPLAAIFLVRSRMWRRLALAAMIISCAAASDLLFGESARAALSLLNYAHYFFAGFLLCDIYLTNDQPQIHPFLWDLLGAAGVLYVLLVHGRLSGYLLPWVAVAIYLAGFRGKVMRAIVSCTPVSVVGGMCYSIYLTHALVLTLTAVAISRLFHGRLTPLATTAIIFSVALPGVLAVGAAYFKLVERPCMSPDWPARLARRWRHSTASVGVAG